MVESGQVADLDATAIAHGVNGGTLDPADVIDAFLQVIAAKNPILNAVVDLDTEAPRREAMALRARLAAGERLPLAGVPLVVKDIIWVAGRRITQGSLLFRDFRPERDALAVARARAAGAVVIGLGNTSEFGCKWNTTNKLFGQTAHPLDADLTPGGSSGGCASAVGAGMAPLALGSDGGGSVRRPAAHVGIVGFKPSNGAVADPFAFPDLSLGAAVIGPMARTVADTRLLFEAIVGTDPRDPTGLPLGEATTQAPRIAYSPDFGLRVPVDRDVADAVDSAMVRLDAAGMRFECADPVWPDWIGEGAIAPIQDAGLAALYGARWRETPELFDPDIGVQIERGLGLSGTSVANALQAASAIAAAVARFFAAWDLVIGPTTPCVAWPRALLSPPAIGGLPAPPRGHAVFTPLFNHARVPAISIPCGAGRDGLPVGLQLVGARGTDRTVLRAAAFVETCLGAAATPWRGMERAFTTL